MSKTQDKEYITIMTKLKSTKQDDNVLQLAMNEILSYKTKRFAYLKDNNLLGQYNKKECDAYRLQQTFKLNEEDENSKTSTILDARYARAIDINLQARSSSLIECLKLELIQKITKKEILESQFLKAQKEYNASFKSNTAKRLGFCEEKRQKKYKILDRLNTKILKISSKIETIEKEIESPTYKHIVFGGRKLFKERLLSGVQYQEWIKKWHNRADEIECGGSGSEEFGNKKFQLTLSKEQPKKGKMRFDLKIALPFKLQQTFGKSYILKNIVFPRNQQMILQNALNHHAYQDAKKLYEKSERKIKKIKNEKQREKKLAQLKLKKPDFQAYQCKTVSILIKKKDGQFYLHLSMPRNEVKVISNDKRGVIGVDINHNNISISEISKQGKLLHSKVYRFNFGHKKRGAYREASINKHIKDIVAYAKEKKKDIILENLDFAHIKSKQLKNLDKNYNRMLHTLAYAKIKESFRVNCYIQGINLDYVNASYTSMLGKTLYSKKYGISTHQAAAYVVARRYYNLLENYVSRTINFIYKDKVCSLKVPVDIFKKQDKIESAKFWGSLYHWLTKELKAPSSFYKKEEPLPS